MVSFHVPRNPLCGLLPLFSAQDDKRLSPPRAEIYTAKTAAASPARIKTDVEITGVGDFARELEFAHALAHINSLVGQTPRPAPAASGARGDVHCEDGIGRAAQYIAAAHNDRVAGGKPR